MIGLSSWYIIKHVSAIACCQIHCVTLMLFRLFSTARRWKTTSRDRDREGDRLIVACDVTKYMPCTNHTVRCSQLTSWRKSCSAFVTLLSEHAITNNGFVNTSSLLCLTSAALYCADPIVPHGSSMRRESNDVIVVSCRATGDHWRQTCIDGIWSGDVIGNCSSIGRFNHLVPIVVISHGYIPNTWFKAVRVVIAERSVSFRSTACENICNCVDLRGNAVSKLFWENLFCWKSKNDMIIVWGFQIFFISRSWIVVIFYNFRTILT